MRILLIITIVVLFLLSALLVLLVFLQNPKDQGGRSTIGIGVQQIVGVARMSSILEKVTYTLAAVILALTLLTSFSVQQGIEREVETDAVLEQLEEYAKQLADK